MSDAHEKYERDFCMTVVRCVEELSDEEFSSLCFILNVSQQVREKQQTRAGILQYLKEHGKISSERPEDFVEVLGAEGLRREELAKRMRRLTERHSNVIHTVQPLQATNIPTSSPAVEEYATPGSVQFRQKRDEKASSSAVKRQGIHIKKSTDDTQTDSDSPYPPHGVGSAAEKASGPNSPNTVIAKLFMDYATSEETWVEFAEQARNLLCRKFFTYIHGQNKNGEDRTAPASVPPSYMEPSSEWSVPPSHMEPASEWSVPSSESSVPPSHMELGPDPDMKRHGSTRSKRSSGYNSMVLEPVQEEIETLMTTTSLHNHEQVSVSSPEDQVTASSDDGSMAPLCASLTTAVPCMETSGLDMIQVTSVTKIMQQMRIKQSDIQRDIASTHKQRIYKSQPFACGQDSPQFELQFHPKLGYSSLYICMTDTQSALRSLLPMDVKVSVCDSDEPMSSCITSQQKRLEISESFSSIRLPYTAQHCVAVFPEVVSQEGLQSIKGDSIIIQAEFGFEQ